MKRVSFIAYILENVVNRKVYVGITSRSLRQRSNDHRSHARTGESSRLYNAMRCHGLRQFAIRPIATARSWEDLLDLEKVLIAQYGSRNHLVGYNMTDGGDGTRGWVPDRMTRERIAAASRLQMSRPGVREHLARCSKAYMTTPEARARVGRMSASRPRSEEEKAKISKAQIGRVKTASERANIAAALRGKPRPPEVRAKISASKQGKPQPEGMGAKVSAALKGRPKTEAHRAAMREVHARRRALRATARPPEVCPQVPTAKPRTPMSADTRAKISTALTGKPKTEAHCAALRAAAARIKAEIASLSKEAANATSGG